MTQEIIVRSDAINWTWYTWLKVGDITDGRALVEVVKSDRFHKFDERQGANEHPKTPWRMDHAAHKPVLRKAVPYGGRTEPTEEQIAQEEQSFNFFWAGWESNCASAKIGTEQCKTLFWMTNGESKEKLLGIVSDSVGT